MLAISHRKMIRVLFVTVTPPNDTGHCTTFSHRLLTTGLPLLAGTFVVIATSAAIARTVTTPTPRPSVRHGAAPVSSVSTSSVRSTRPVGTNESRAALRARLRAERRVTLTDDKKAELRQAFDAAAAEAATSNLAMLRAIGPFLAQTSTGRDDFLTKIADRIAESEKTPGVIFDVKGPHVYFATTSPLAEKLNRIDVSYDLPHVLSLLKERGIYTMARFIALKDPGLAGVAPETQIHNPKTGVSVGDVWVDGSNATTLGYNMEVLKDLIESGIDEVNFDYIRFPTEYSLAQVGLTKDEKIAKVEAFLKAARQLVNENGGKTKLGISTYAIIGWNYDINVEYLGQDVVRFAPLVDVISPMAYPDSFSKDDYYTPGKNPGSRMYYLVYRTMTGYQKELGSEAWKLRPWIQGYYVDRQDVQDQINAVFDAGACGFTVWNANNNYDPTFAALDSWDAPENCVPKGFPYDTTVVTKSDGGTTHAAAPQSSSSQTKKTKSAH